MQSKNYLLAIISIIVIVGIVLFVTNNYLVITDKNVAGEAINAKTTIKQATTSSKTATKTSLMKATTKQFCGDRTCLDGKHVSCYQNTKGICECEKCSLFPKQKKQLFEKIFDKNAILPICYSEPRVYEKDAPIIDAFMLGYFVDVDEETFQQFGESLEMAFCNATSGKVGLNVRA